MRLSSWNFWIWLLGSIDSNMIGVTDSYKFGVELSFKEVKSLGVSEWDI